VQSVTLTGITIAEPAELRVASGSGTNTVYWTWPGSGYADGVVVLRRSGGTPQIPADGGVLNAGDTLADGSRVIARTAMGGATSAADAGLTPGAAYYYRAFGYFTSGTLYSTAGVSVDAPGTGSNPGQPRWVVSSSTSGWVEATLDGNGGVLWGSPAGGVVDSSTADGRQVWSPLLTGKRLAGAVSLTEIEGQTGWYAVVGTDAGTVAAVDVPTGTVLWETGALGAAIGSAVGMQSRAYSDAAFQGAFSGDVMFVGTKNGATNNRVYALDAATGTVLWTFNASGATAMDQVTGWAWVDHATNRLIVTTRSNGGAQPSLWALSTLDGTLQASWSLGDVTAWLGLAMDGGIYVATAGGKLYELDPASLTMTWAAPFDAGAGNAIVSYVWEDWGWPGRLFFSTQDGHVWALDAPGGSTTPTVAWSTAVAGASAPLVLTQDGVLWVGGSDGQVHQLRLADGVDERQATVGDGSAAVGTPGWDSASGWLYVGTAAGKLFAIPTPLP
jgi:outer membrane protein assembly factor BamB